MSIPSKPNEYTILLEGAPDLPYGQEAVMVDAARLQVPYLFSPAIDSARVSHLPRLLDAAI